MDASHQKVHLSCAEISNLWDTYINDSVVKCILTHFLKTVEDSEVKPLLEFTIEVADSHLSDISRIYEQEGIARPEGFPVEKHVNLSAPRLFSDIFFMEYMQHMSKFGLSSHSNAIATSARDDIRSLFEKFHGQALELNREITTLMKKKGVYIRPPYMNYPKKAEFVDKQNFLTGWLGKKRPLLGNEVNHLYMTSLHNELGKSTLIGFAQVAQERELKSYFHSGIQLSDKILRETHHVLMESDVPNSMTWDAIVTESTNPPYSDQLMLFVVGILFQLGVAAYGLALSMCMRRDVGALYSSFILRALTYSEDGAQMIIERGWLEQPPMFADRDKLIKGE
ncbi:DUF3231 family protein [Mesobacillus jeotgali]|uniref:DUF3231 family protein n=1 Tax=Mesobacillus jeotgali TaxID=129985 RepID=UPI0009A5DDF5|nr:DUF3231 family protein [Mesobacillus jeotgali]